jgi:chitin disaccharide deacetylase
MQRTIHILIITSILCFIIGCSQSGSETESVNKSGPTNGNAEETYDLAAISGAWILESDTSSVRPYLITDGKGTLIDWSMAGGGSGTYSIAPDGAFVISVGGTDTTGLLTLSSSSAGSIRFDQYADWHISKVSNLSGCEGTWQGTISDDHTAKTSRVIIVVDSQGVVTSIQGLDQPVSGRMLNQSGKVSGFIETGKDRHMISIKATRKGDAMTGTVIADDASSATGSLALTRVTYSVENAVKLLLEHHGVRKGLIINGDDLAMGHFTNDAIFAAWDEGAITSTSLFTVTMVYAPDGQPVAGDPFAEAIEGIRQRNGIDVGCHLTLNSTDGFLIRPVLPPDQIPTLVDEDGYLEKNSLTFLFSSWDEIKAECRAQIEKALSNGVQLSHLDCHMGWGHFPGPIRDLYVELADEYRLPLRWMLGLPDGPRLIDHKVLVPTKFVILDDSDITEVTSDTVEKRKQSLLRTLRNLPDDSITEVLCHPSRETAYGQAWRVLDYLIVSDPEVRAQIASMCASGELVMLGFNDLKQTMRRL